jgi:hypothetical protein
LIPASASAVGPSYWNSGFGVFFNEDVPAAALPADCHDGWVIGEKEYRATPRSLTDFVHESLLQKLEVFPGDGRQKADFQRPVGEVTVMSHAAANHSIQPAKRP